MRDFLFGQTYGFAAISAMKMQVQIGFQIAVALILTQSEFGNSGTVVYFMNQSVILKGFKCPVYRSPFHFVKSKLDIGETGGYRLLFQELIDQQTHGGWLYLFLY